MSGACPADVAAFKEILRKDPESSKCFECGYPNAPWCDINHGVFICLDCSGTHRGLGVHLSFVRSSTMDGWTNWRPDKLKQMECGGNKKARLFFEAKGVPAKPIRSRYEHTGALMYKDKLEAEGAGRVLNEMSWKPPDWALKSVSNEADSTKSKNTKSPTTNRFQGVGCTPTADDSRSKYSSSEWLTALSAGMNTVTQKAVESASTATTTVSSTTQAYLNEKELQKVKEKASAGALQAWSSVASWTHAGVATLSSWAAKQSAALNGECDEDQEEDGLSALTKNIEKVEGAEKLGHNEHIASPQESTCDGFATLTAGLKPSNKYQGVGKVVSPAGAPKLKMPTPPSQSPVQNSPASPVQAAEKQRGQQVASAPQKCTASPTSNPSPVKTVAEKGKMFPSSQSQITKTTAPSPENKPSENKDLSDKLKKFRESQEKNNDDWGDDW